MAWFSPTPAEISAIEQIETVYHDNTLQNDRREKMIRRLWEQLENAHGSRVLSLVSPEGTVIQSPFQNA